MFQIFFYVDAIYTYQILAHLCGSLCAQIKTGAQGRTCVPAAIWWIHKYDVIMVAMASQITSLTIVYSTLIQAQIKENIKDPRHYAFVWGIHRWVVNFRAQMASIAENVSIWWRHHANDGLRTQPHSHHMRCSRRDDVIMQKRWCTRTCSPEADSKVMDT